MQDPFIRDDIGYNSRNPKKQKKQKKNKNKTKRSDAVLVVEAGFERIFKAGKKVQINEFLKSENSSIGCEVKRKIETFKLEQEGDNLVYYLVA